MASINKVILFGRIGRDPEVKYLNDGKAIAKFSLATSESWKDKQTGERKEKTEWHRLVSFDKRAEFIGEYLGKGREVYVEGKLQTRSWEQGDVTRYITEIVVNDIQPVGGRPAQQDQQGGGQRQSQGYGPGHAPSYQQGSGDAGIEDIPF